MIRPLLIAAAASLVALLAAGPAQAQSDLLVAPTRLVLDGNGSGEVIVSNKGDHAATYRISLVLRRMDANGLIQQVDEAQATPQETAAIDILTYAPRKVTLAAQEARTVRIGVRAPATLPPGEYRAHLLFRSVPDVADPARPEGAAPADGMTIKLTPIYGVAIPVIVRVGPVSGGAKLEHAALTRDGAETRLSVDLVRSGNRSVYGDLLVVRDGKALMTVKGIAAYPEVDRRRILLPADMAKLGSPAGLKLRFVETDPAGEGKTSEVPLGN